MRRVNVLGSRRRLNIPPGLRWYNSASGTEVAATNIACSASAAKPYAAIPGPRGPLGLGTLYQYLPWVGTYSWHELHKVGRDKYDRYGPIVRETMVPGQEVVWLFDPADIATLLNDRDYPQRRSHLALAHYRRNRPHVYSSAGLLATNGAEWWRLRSEAQKELSAPSHARRFLADADAVTQEFLAALPRERSFDVLPAVTRLNLELTCLFVFGVRLNAFSPAEAHPESRSSRLIRAAEDTNGATLPTEQGLQLWRLWETPAYGRLRRAQQYMESVAVELCEQSRAGATERPSLVAAYLRNPALRCSDVLGTAADLLLAGIDTTSYSMAFVLYHLARQPSVQRRLAAEADAVLAAAAGEDGGGGESATALSGEVLRSRTPYARAVLKESLRLNPVSVGVGRIVNRDLVLSGYHVPKGTVVVTQNMIACRLERHFAQPLHFLPERWLQRAHAAAADGSAQVHPYLVLPFGHGMRACIARRLAEQNMLVMLLRLAHSYDLAWIGDGNAATAGGELDVRTLLINKPSKPVNILLRARQ